MKKYILIGIILSSLVNADNNPFALDKNLQKIDKEQEILLSSFKDIDKSKQKNIQMNAIRKRHLQQVAEKARLAKKIREERAEAIRIKRLTEKKQNDKKRKAYKLAQEKTKKIRLEKEKLAKEKLIKENLKKRQDEAKAQKIRKEREEAMRIKKIAEKKRNDEKRKAEQLAQIKLAKEKAIREELEKKRLQKILDEKIRKANEVAKREKELSDKSKAIDKVYLDAIKDVNL